MRIEHLFCDNEGCIIPGKGLPMPLDRLARLAALLRENGMPRFSLCTGRSIPYVEAMVQILGLTHSPDPQICEGGAALYWPIRELAGSGPDEPAYEQLSNMNSRGVSEELAACLPHGAFRVELGKIGCVSLYPNAGWTVDALFGAVRETWTKANHYNLLRSSAAVDITPHGVDKASGIRAVCERLEVPLGAIACIGDSENDLPMLRAAGFAACPANATDDVKAVVDFVAKGEATEGVIEILCYLRDRK